MCPILKRNKKYRLCYYFKLCVNKEIKKIRKHCVRKPIIIKLANIYSFVMITIKKLMN